MSSQTMNCLLVEKSGTDEVRTRLTAVETPELKEDDVLIKVRFSSLNYKDALAATGHPGIVRNFPHVPGIDAAGVVVESRDSRYKVGDEVIATGHELGVERWGGWSSHLVSPAEWLVPVPKELTLEESMTIGTAGFTAAQCVQTLLKHGCKPGAGPVIVSGATGGVGSLSVMLLAKLGFDVLAVTGKSDKHNWLKQLGATDVVDRDVLSGSEKRPLLKGEFAAGIDTVGGQVLATMLKKIEHRGCVACCGVVGGADVSTTVYPFILRGIALYGIDSAWCPDDVRLEIWSKLATDWKLKNLFETKVDLSLPTINKAVEQILAGEFSGRGVFRIEE